MRVEEPIDAKIYQINEQKQIKFKMNVIGYKVYGGEFVLGELKVDIKKPMDKQSRQYKVVIPYHLYN